MAWIFSTFNLFSFYFFFGCAGQPPPPPRKPSVTQKVTKVRQPSSPVLPGPTRPRNNFFVDVTQTMGLDNVIAARLYAIDFNNDGYTDLVTLPKHYSPAEFYQFIPTNKVWKKIDSPFESNGIVRASFLAFADFDKDGVNDVIVATFNQKTELTPRTLRLFQGYLQQNHYKLKEVPNSFPQHIDPISSLTFLDYNLDGHLDVYVGNWYDNRHSPARIIPDRLYKGKIFTFKDQSHLLKGNLKYSRTHNHYPNARPTSGASVCDMNKDGYPDILTASTSGFGNLLWISQGNNNGFEDQGVSSGYAFDPEGSFLPRGGGNSTFSKCADYNNDGMMDVAVGEILMSYDNNTRDISGILTGFTLQPSIKFFRRNYYRDDGSQLNHRGDRRGVWLDYNNDGLTDLLIDNSGFPPHSRLTLFQQESNHGFLDQSKELGIDILNPSGSITIDFNRDGNLDIITGQVSTRKYELKKRLYVFKNNHPMPWNVYRFHLRGHKSNIHGLGGTLIVRSDKNFYRQAVDYLYGPFPSQNEEGIRLALPPGETLQFVEAHWPILEQSRPLVKRYSFETIPSKKNNVYTLCETGEMYPYKKIKCE